ncbi:MAG TPA: hypothetical protein VF593_09850, partial [Chthoniobacteraceae bacterium]
MPEPSKPSSPDPFEHRLRFGSFEILRDDAGKPCLLGKGAFGRTYKARHVFLDRAVAREIKPRSRGDAEGRKGRRFNTLR